MECFWYYKVYIILQGCSSNINAYEGKWIRCSRTRFLGLLVLGVISYLGMYFLKYDNFHYGVQQLISTRYESQRREILAYPNVSDPEEVNSQRAETFATVYLSKPEEVEYLEIHKPRRLWFTRVPKCASSSMQHITREICKQNKDCHYSKLGSDPRGGKINAKKVAQLFLKSPTLTYGPDCHVFFINFTQYGFERPDHFSIIRDPLEHRISMYYYLIRREHKRLKNVSLDKCLEQKLDICTNKYYDNSKFNIITYFCGQEEMCRQNTDASLTKAISHVERYYTVVGIQEDFQSTIELLEHTYPTFMSGALQLFKSKIPANKSPNRLNDSETTKSFLMSQLSKDYIFYQYIKKRFYKNLYAMKRYTD